MLRGTCPAALQPSCPRPAPPSRRALGMLLSWGLSAGIACSTPAGRSILGERALVKVRKPTQMGLNGDSLWIAVRKMCESRCATLPLRCGSGQDATEFKLRLCRVKLRPCKILAHALSATIKKKQWPSVRPFSCECMRAFLSQRWSQLDGARSAVALANCPEPLSLHHNDEAKSRYCKTKP